MSDRFTRSSGAGNTFFIVNVFDPLWSEKFSLMSDSDRAQLAKKVCQGFDGFETDGLLFVRPEAGYDFAWDFFNSDGSQAEMCGNAARCAALFYFEKVKQMKKIRFKTLAGEISGEILSDGEVRVEMTRIHDIRPMTVLEKKGIFVNSGVPHFVIQEKADVELARRLRKVSDFGPAGANITFVEMSQGSHVRAVTFERGVENFTQACGTGAVAAAVWLQVKNGKLNSIQVEMPGGNLTIENAVVEQRPLLSGPTKLEFDMTLLENAK